MIIFVFTILLSCSFACTYFESTNSVNQTVIGRSMELGNGSMGQTANFTKNWNLHTYPIGSAKISNPKGYVCIETPVTFNKTTTYNISSEGMNQDGFSVSQNTHVGAKYQQKQDGYNLFFADLTNWALGKFSTVQQAVAELKSIRVVDIYNEPQINGMHWALADATGDSAVIEYVDGVLNVHNNTAGVLTNDPDYKWHLYNLNNYVNLSPRWPQGQEGIQVETEVGKVPRCTNHGYNLAGIPGDSSPPSRFVRAFYLKQYANLNNPALTVADSVTAVTAILNQVTIPKGTVASFDPSAEKPEFTQYAVIKVPTERTFMFRSYDNMQWQKIDISKLDLKRGAKEQQKPVYDGSTGIKDITDQLMDDKFLTI